MGKRGCRTDLYCTDKGQKEALERCVLCGRLTPVKRDSHIAGRRYYVEGGRAALRALLLRCVSDRISRQTDLCDGREKKKISRPFFLDILLWMRYYDDIKMISIKYLIPND